MNNESVFRSAITGPDGGVDAGYLALFWTMMATLPMIPIIGMSGVILAWRATAENIGPILQQTGIAITAIAGGCATVVGAVGLFRVGDKPRAGTTTTTVMAASETKSEVKGE